MNNPQNNIEILIPAQIWVDVIYDGEASEDAVKSAITEAVHKQRIISVDSFKIEYIQGEAEALLNIVFKSEVGSGVMSADSESDCLSEITVNFLHEIADLIWANLKPKI